ncbi:hypothetical protein F4811DRAFT_499412 [Daldinia bambusicola]|nr:hypothetical protein F4811DRAFT_499412 [Daldinia bambusicola]
MIQDILFYLENHFNKLNIDHPESVRIFLEEIIVSHFLKLAEYQDDLEGIMLQLGVPPTCSPDTRDLKNWTDNIADFQHLLHRFLQMEKRVNLLSNPINTLATLVGNRVSYRTGELSLSRYCPYR